MDFIYREPSHCVRATRNFTSLTMSFIHSHRQLKISPHIIYHRFLLHCVFPSNLMRKVSSQSEMSPATKNMNECFSRLSVGCYCKYPRCIHNRSLAHTVTCHSRKGTTVDKYSLQSWSLVDLVLDLVVVSTTDI